MFLVLEIRAHDGLFAVRTHRKNRDRHIQFLLKECHISIELCRELILVLDFGHIRVPTLYLLIDWLHTVLDAVREITCQRAVHLVSRTSLDCRECVEHVALHHNQLSDTAEHNCITESHKVYPSATAFTSSHRAIFMTEVAYFTAGLVKKFCRERTAAHACAISLENTEHLTNAAWSHTKAAACSGTDGVA